MVLRRVDLGATFLAIAPFLEEEGGNEVLRALFCRGGGHREESHCRQPKRRISAEKEARGRVHRNLAQRVPVGGVAGDAGVRGRRLRRMTRRRARWVDLHEGASKTGTAPCRRQPGHGPFAAGAAGDILRSEASK